MRIRSILTLAIPLACAALFGRLGVWQLSRLAERRAFNATLSARRSAPVADVFTLPPDTAQGHYRRASASGTLLYDREVVLAGRAHQGSPGADLLTPLALPGRDTVVLVNRGWVYSADAATVDQSRWRERDSATVSGFAEIFAPARGRSAAVSTLARAFHSLDHAEIERAVGRPVAPYVLVQTSDSAIRDSVPVRLEFPAIDEGPHRSYAVQWFMFAVIAVVGGGILFRKQTADGAGVG